MTVGVNDLGTTLRHLAEFYNMSDDRCKELATNDEGVLNAEQALLNMLERDLCTDISNKLVRSFEDL